MVYRVKLTVTGISNHKNFLFITGIIWHGIKDSMKCDIITKQGQVYRCNRNDKFNMMI